jgi:superfamily II DNA or RNA helicase
MLHVGARIRLRRQRWRVVDVRRHDDSCLITVIGTGAANVGITRRFLTPFDEAELLVPGSAVRFVTRRRWQTACRHLLAAARSASTLAAAARARMELLPHQLEPALAIVEGLGTRVLLADEVGLGKTVQAALILAELRARHAADRVLVLTPAGLREQWAGELRDRLSLAATVVDLAALHRRGAALPVGSNPWSTLPLVIASLDYVKRPEVLPGVQACRWDLVIVDEAHLAATASDRHEAAAALCGRAAYVVLVTATPHSGDRQAFHALCRLGAHDGDGPLLFRRGRADVALGVSRRVHRLPVRSSRPERRMHDALMRVARAVETRRGLDVGSAGWLALAVLFKRAFSSAHALAATVRRRLALLSAPDTGHQQLDLLIAEEGELDPTDEPPAWVGPLVDNPAFERGLLGPLAEAAERAAGVESKLACLTRLVGRLHRRGEPAIVFTEYRDTLLRVRGSLPVGCAVIHGGMSPRERLAALEDFGQGRAPLLLATDAAAEGLNLQATCRVVINLELPWNPVRLEQRIGRVDRIGQRRTVHAFHLIARDTREMDVMRRLRSRIAAAREDIDAADPLGAREERTVAHVVLTGRHEAAVAPSDGDSEQPDGALLRPRLADAALAERARLAHVRLLTRHDRALPDEGLDAGVWLTFARKPAVRVRLACRVLFVVKQSVADGHGREIACRLSGWMVRLAGDVARHELMRTLAPALLRWLEEEGAPQTPSASGNDGLDAHRRFWMTRLRRERAIAMSLSSGAGDRYQPGLFDRRADRERLEARSESQRVASDAARLLGAAERAASIEVMPPRPLLVLLP